MKLNRSALALAVVITAAAAAAGCGALSAARPVATQPPSAPAGAGILAGQGSAGRSANPVPLLLRTGAKQDPSFPPSTDIYGDRFAQGTLSYDCPESVYANNTVPPPANPCPQAYSEAVDATTYATLAAMADDLARNSRPSDGSRCIAPKDPRALWTVWVTPVTDMNGNNTFPVPLTIIAQRVGGTACAVTDH